MLQYRNEMRVDSVEPSAQQIPSFSVNHFIKNNSKGIEKHTTFVVGNQVFSIMDVF